jgi:hypothetical protein
LAGIDTTLPTLGEMVWFLRSAGRGKKIPKGFLLVGPPGTGKTFLVQAIAGEAEVPVVIQSATLLIDPESKESPVERLQNVFQQARRNAPCILFIDEIDTLGTSREGVMRNTMGADHLIESVINPSLGAVDPGRGFAEEDDTAGDDAPTPARGEGEDVTAGGGGWAEQEEHGKSMEADRSPDGDQDPSLENTIRQSHQTSGLVDKQRLSLLMQLLVEMDGLSNLHGLVVVGATNRPGVLDPALLRPGRFERVVQLELPGEGKRIEILRLYSHTIGVSRDVSWRYLAHRTVGFSAADLSAVMNQSSIQAILDGTTHTIETIEAGIETIGRRPIRRGLPSHQHRLRQSRSRNEGGDVLNLVLPARWAYYQAGKAVVRTTLPPHPPVSHLPLSPESGIESFHLTKGFVGQPSSRALDGLTLEAKLIGLYAGKAAEVFALSDHLGPLPRSRWVGNRGVWDSDLGAEEIRLATQVADSMLTTWYLQSNEIPWKETTRVVATQNGEEMEEPSQQEYCKGLSEANEMEGAGEGEADPGPQSHSCTAWWQSQVTTELELVQPDYSNWYRFYLPDPAEGERNDEWIPPDEHYHGLAALQNIAAGEREASFSWNQFDLLSRDYLLHGLLTTCFDQAFAVIEERRELLDYFADHLIRFHLLRRHTIQLIDLQFTV